MVGSGSWYIQKGGRAGREWMINPRCQEESVAMQEFKTEMPVCWMKWYIMEWSFEGGWTCMVEGRSICLAGHLHGLVSVQNIRGLRGFLSSIWLIAGDRSAEGTFSRADTTRGWVGSGSGEPSHAGRWYCKKEPRGLEDGALVKLSSSSSFAKCLALCLAFPAYLRWHPGQHIAIFRLHNLL